MSWTSFLVSLMRSLMSDLQLPPSVLAARRPPARLVLATVTARPAWNQLRFSVYGSCPTAPGPVKSEKLIEPLEEPPENSIKTAQSTARPWQCAPHHVQCKRAFCAALSRLSPATHPAGAPGAGGSGSASHGLGSLIGVECWFFVEAFHFDCLFPVDFKQKGSTACPNQLEYLHVGLQSNSPNTASPWSPQHPSSIMIPSRPPWDYSQYDP